MEKSVIAIFSNLTQDNGPVNGMQENKGINCFFNIRPISPLRVIDTRGSGAYNFC